MTLVDDNGMVCGAQGMRSYEETKNAIMLDDIEEMIVRSRRTQATRL